MSNVAFAKRPKFGMNLALLKENLFWFEWLYLFVSVWLIVEIIFLAMLRLNFPDSFDSVEGATVVQIQRILSGMFVYGPPDLSYIALMYPPFYLYVSAALSQVLGDGFLAPRLISFFSLIGTLVLVGRFATRESGDVKLGILAAGICAGGAEISAYLINMVRVDWLFAFLLVLALYILRFNKSYHSAVLGAVIFCLATLTKQTALLLIPFLGAGLASENVKRGTLFFVLASMLCGLSYIFLNYATDGWFFYYVFKVPSSHYIDASMNANFIKFELLGILVIPLILSSYAIFTWHREGKKYNVQFYSRILLFVLFMCWIPRVKIGGFVNNLFPLCVIFAMLTPLGFQQLYSLRETRILSMMMVIVILFSKVYSPEKYIMQSEDLQAVAEVRQDFKEMPPGPIFSPQYMYLPSEVGRNNTALWGAILDVQMAEEASGNNELFHLLESKITKREFAVIVLSEKLFLQEYFPYLTLYRYYSFAGRFVKAPYTYDMYLPNSAKT